MIERTNISLEDWAKLSGPTDDQYKDIVELLTQENEILTSMGFGGIERYNPPWHERVRNWIGRKLVRLGFEIAPDIMDEYRD